MTDPTDLAISAASGGVTVTVIGLLIAGWRNLFSDSRGLNADLINQVQVLTDRIDAMYSARANDQRQHEDQLTEIRILLRECEERDHRRAMEVDRLRNEIQRNVNPSNGHSQ